MTGAEKVSSTIMRSRVALVTALVTVLLLAASTGAYCSGMPRAQKHESRHEIDQLEHMWRNAILSGNTVAMNALLADDYMAITPSGTLQTKDQALGSLRAGRMHFTSLNISERKVRFYGTTAVVTSTAQVQGTTGDGDVSGSYRYTRVYVRDSRGGWKIVSFEANRILDSSEHK